MSSAKKTRKPAPKPVAPNLGDDDHIAHHCADIRPRLDDIADYARHGQVGELNSEILLVLRSLRAIELLAEEQAGGK